jgi:hypothetical protein
MSSGGGGRTRDAVRAGIGPQRTRAAAVDPVDDARPKAHQMSPKPAGLAKRYRAGRRRRDPVP